MSKQRNIVFLLGTLLLACGSAGQQDPSGANAMEPSTGERIFNMNCAICHGRDGRLGLNEAKDLTLSTLTAEEMQVVIAQGKGNMMPYGNVLSAAEMEEVVRYVRTLKSSE